MRADRLLSLLMLLQIKGQCTAQELARRLEVSERTIYRDIEALSMAGVPVYAERGPAGGCMLAEGYRTNLTGLTETEVRSLFMPGVLGPLADLGVSKALEAAFLKLLAALPSAHQKDVERTRQRLYMDATGWWYIQEAIPHLQLLQEAIWQDQKIQIVHKKSSGEISERVVDPLGLVVKAGVWYLVAVSHEQLRVFRVSRILEALVLAEACQRPEGFDLKIFWTEWCTTFLSQTLACQVTAKIAPQFIAVLPQIMGESIHKLIEEAGPADEKGWITLPLTFDSYETARTQMLGFGAMIEVVEPQQLRNDIIRIASEITQLYSTKADKE